MTTTTTREQSIWHYALNLLHSSKEVPLTVKAAMIFLLLMILLAILGTTIAPYPITQTDILNAMQPPVFVSGGNTNHLLGTDNLGRDILSRLLFSIRITVIVAFIGTIISAIMGTVLGMIAGQTRGFVEETIMMIVDIQASLPFLVFALTTLAILGNSFTVLLIVIGINGWDSFARLSRGMVLMVMGQDYILAAQSIGISRFGLYRRYLLPNILSAIIVQFSITLAGTILLESALSFLGLGIQQPMTSLGQMLGDGRDYLLFASWLSIIPGSVIFFMILSISLLGDWLRDVLDPTSQH